MFGVRTHEIDVRPSPAPRRRVVPRRMAALAAAGALSAGMCAATAVAAGPAAALAAGRTTHAGALAPGLLRRVGPATGFGRARANSQSNNWSGYIKSGQGLKNSTASWHVPAVSPQHDGYSSSWVGIDGATDQYLIQTGTEQDVINGQPRYYGWWEVITPTNPAPEVRYTGFTIKPGDAMTAGVKNNGNGKWTMTLTDRTTGVTRSHTAAFAGPGASAEWIQEDTDVNGFISPAPNWHKVTFTGVTVGGKNPKLSTAEAVDIYDSLGTQEDHTGKPNATDNGFTVTWLATGTATPAP